jgi:hypothetical protein
MKPLAAIVAILLMTSVAHARCDKPAYQQVPGSRLASVSVLPFAAALTILTIPAGIIGSATRTEPLAKSTPTMACYTGRFAKHTVVGNR